MSRINELINQEYKRQLSAIQLIASENLPSQQVFDICKYQMLQFKTAEGRIGNRYQGGCEYIDEIESIALDSILNLFGAKYANVQPNSATIANQAIFKAFAPEKKEPLIFAMDIKSGGHVSHSLQFKNVVTYSVDQDSGLLDYNKIRIEAIKYQPDIIIAGSSAYPRQIDFCKFREISDEVGAYLVADIAHYAGLIAAGVYPSPINYAHASTISTYKTLRGPRSGAIIVGAEFNSIIKGKKISSLIDSSLFPKTQGSPNMFLVAAKAVCFYEAQKIEFKKYARQIIKNSRALASKLIEYGFKLVTDGTDSHIVLVDLTSLGITGITAQILLEKLRIITNKNFIPYDSLGANLTSGLRLGTPFLTSRGMKEKEMELIAYCIYRTLMGRKHNADNLKIESKITNEITDIVNSLNDQFPIGLDL